MRFTVIASLVAGSDALLSRRSPAPLSADLEAQKATLEQEEKEWKKQKSDLDKKLKDAGYYDTLHGSSAEQQTSKIRKEYKALHEAAHEKSKNLSHEEALDKLKDKIPADERKQIAMLMESDKAKEDEKMMYVKAVTTLNDMFLSVEDERTTLITTCHAELFEKYRRLFLTWDTLFEIFMMGSKAWSTGWKAFYSKVEAYGELYKEQEKLGTIKAQQANVMAGLDEELVKREADAALYRFIIGAFDEQCSKKEGALLQTDKAAFEKQQQCNEKCASQGKSAMNKAVLSVFANPAVMDKAKWSLNEHAQMSLKETLEHIRKAEAEEVHHKYSFLQVKSEKYEPWRVDEADGCGCGSLESMSCDVMMTLIGQELECAKEMVREQEGIINKQKEEDSAELQEQNDVITNIRQHISNQDELILNANAELKSYRPQFWEAIDKLFSILHTIHVQQFKCILRLQDLEQNQYCALKHIRQYLSDMALKAFNADEDAMSDCEVDDELYPVGMCMRGPEEVPCIRGDVLPTSEDQMPKQMWQRGVITAPSQDAKLIEAMGNKTIALQCPNTMEMEMNCNLFLCPLDCEVSEWSQWSSCTADCDSGYQQRTRLTTQLPRNGGGKCPDTSESQECNTHACDVDCVLHEDWVDDAGCLQACTQNPYERRTKMLKKHIEKEAEGKGECPEKFHESRIMESDCDDPVRPCAHDEICADTMDLVLAYECSVATSRLGCWFMASFVVALLQKMPASTFGWASMKVGLVKFGNGMSVKVPGEKDKYFVKPARRLSELSSQIGTLPAVLYGDVIGMWSGQTKWHMGFNNVGQALILAGQMLDESPRSGDSSVVSRKKIVVLTKGKRTKCTVMKSVSAGLKEKGVVVDVVLFSQTYATNPDEFESIQESVTYPYKYHLHNPGAATRLNDWGFRMQTAQGLIPKICPGAVSPWHTLRKMCDSRVQILHRGRTCHDWTKKLTDGPVSVEECRNKAFEKGYKAFIHTDVSEEEEATECNCFTHPEDGKKESVNEDGTPREDTCNYVADYGKDTPDEHKGWVNQEIAAGNGELTTHYRVLESAAECPGAYGAYFQKVFQNNWNPAVYFVK